MSFLLTQSSSFSECLWTKAEPFVVSATLSKFSIVCKFAEGAVSVIVHVVNEDIEKHGPQY